MIKTQKSYLIPALFIITFVLALSLFFNVSTLKAQNAVGGITTRVQCDAAGGSWTTVAGGGAPVQTCSCPAGSVVNGQQCVSIAQSACVDSGGTWSSVNGVNSCDSCPAGKVRSANGLFCVTIPPSTGGGSAPVDLESDLEFGESGSKIFEYLQTGVNLLTALAGLAITGSVIFAGIQYSAAGGNPQATSKAKTRIINAFVALLALVFLFAFFQWLVPGGIFGS